MAATQRTLDQLLALFLDNDDGEISAADGRDLIATVFGHVANVDPTNENDSVDSAGIGAFFSPGARWTNYLTQKVWNCVIDTPMMAVWQTWPDVTPAVVQKIRGRVDVAIPAQPTASGLPTVGVVTLSDGEVVLTSIIGRPFSTRAYRIHPGDWEDVDWWPVGQVNTEPFYFWLGFDQDIHEPAIGNLYAVVPPVVDVLGSLPWTVGEDDPVIRVWGTETVIDLPAEFIGPKMVLRPNDSTSLNWQNQEKRKVFCSDPDDDAVAPTFKLLTPAYIPTLPPSGIGGGGTFDPALIPSLPASIITSGVFDIALIPALPYLSSVSIALDMPADEFDVSGSPAGDGDTLAVTKKTQAANTVWAGPASGAAAAPAFRALTSADLPGGGGGGTLLTWEKYEIDYTDWSSSAPTFTLRAMAPYECVHAGMVQITQAWAFSFGTTATIGSGYADSETGTASGTFPGAQTVMNGGLATPVQNWAVGPFINGPQNFSTTDGWTLTAPTTGAGGAATAGHLILWVLVSTLPH